MPSGLARRSNAPAERKLAAAAYVDALLRNSLLEIADIEASSPAERTNSSSPSGRTHYRLVQSPVAGAEGVDSKNRRKSLRIARVPTRCGVPAGCTSARLRSQR